MLEVVKSFLEKEDSLVKTFQEHYTEYMMNVQDKGIDREMNKLFNNASFEKLLEIDKESTRMYENLLKGNVQNES